MLLFCANCTMELLPMLLGAWLLGGLFWYFFLGSKMSKRYESLQREYRKLNDHYTQLEEDRDILKDHHYNLIKEHDLLLAKLKSPGPIVDPVPAPEKVEGLHFINSNDVEKQRLNFEELFLMTDLKIIEGIGPKIESILKEANINTWNDLSNCNSTKLQKILERTNPNYRVHNPSSWPLQAKLANESRWDELVEMQKAMNIGIGTKNHRNLHAKIEKMAIKKLGLGLHEYTDLKVVEGIGPKIEQLLKNAGIQNWSDLARTDAFNLQNILATAGERFRLANPDSWPHQASMADSGAWKELKQYQNQLRGE